jgi:cytochrome c oxidase assembly protein subunit 15
MKNNLSLWLQANIVITLIVITLGALTRLLDAGLGCPDWPGCYGQIIPPQGIEQIQQANAQHPEFPVEQIKAWSEMIHRYAASLLGLSLLILALVVSFKAEYKAIKHISYIALGWVILQGIFGMLTVTLRIWPPVVTAHLVAGMIMLAICYGQYQVCQGEKRKLPGHLRTPLLLLIIITLIQLGLGAWTSSQYAGLACPDLPQCQNQWWPETVHGPFHAPMVNAQEYLGGLLPMADRMAIQIIHRAGAVVVLLACLFLAIRLFRSQHTLQILLLLSALTLQISIGLANVFFLLPLTLALLHNTGAAIFWLTLWWVYFSVSKDHQEQRSASNIRKKNTSLKQELANEYL